jgi:hypothetical protein
MQFAFKRDREGRETIHVGDVAIARIRHDLPAECDDIEWLASPPAGITAEYISEACVMADERGFWAPIEDRNPRFDRTICGNVKDGIWVSNVAVNVPIPETTSTILSLTTEDER